jgi:hypothetical protein
VALRENPLLAWRIGATTHPVPPRARGFLAHATPTRPTFTGGSGLIGPALAALAATVTVWVRDLVERRDRTYRRNLAITQATQEVGFIQSWVEAYRQVDQNGTTTWSSDRVRHDLDRAYLVLAEPVIEQREPRPTLQSAGGLLGKLVLHHSLTTPMAKAGLVVLYALVGWAVFLSIVVSLLFATAIWLWRHLLLWLDRLWLDRREKRPEGGTVPRVTTPRVSKVSYRSLPAPVVVLVDDEWIPAILNRWHEYGSSWIGEVTYANGRPAQWVPAERLRYTDTPA